MVYHKNNIGVLRLLFASLVVLGHAPEQISGDRQREPLTAIFHTLSLGDLSVGAFFLISGYLITMSMARSKSLWTFLERRVLRIWPGYLVACVLCTFALSPFVGGKPLEQSFSSYVRMLLLLGPVNTPGQLPGLPYPLLNGSIWTIPIEFRCYLLMAALGAVGLLTRRWIMAVLTSAAMGMTVLATFDGVRLMFSHLGRYGTADLLVGSPMRLAAYFLVGSMGYLYRDEIGIRLDRRRVLLCLAGGALLMTDPHTADLGLSFFGGLILFWLSFRADFGRLQAVNDKWDISYGTYLYGWPIATAVLYFNRQVTSAALAGITLPLAWLAGAASWWMVERWTKDLLKSRSDPTLAATPATAGASD